MRLAPRELTAARGDWSIIPGIDAEGGLFPIEKMEAHRRGQKHLAVSVFVFCGERLLVQQRAPGKYHCGGMWANTCCTHPYWDEPADRCAKRRLREEVGIQLPLQERAVVEYHAQVTGGLVENERVHVFEGELRSLELPAGFDRSEISALRWMTRAELQREARTAPESLTPWLRIYLQRWPELRLAA